MAVKKNLLFLLLPILFIACSDPQSPPTDQINQVAVHPAGWADPASENFHGDLLANGIAEISSCQQCHGNDFDGGVVEVSCRTCHASYPHPETGWIDPSSESFHGDLLASVNYELSSCQQCHGNDFEGGRAEVSCRTCHASYPHPEKWVPEHRDYLRTTRWNLQECQSCHGENYDLVKANRSCLTCHTQAGGPEACNTCHGDFSGDASNVMTWAPPKGLNDETDPAQRAVGAHQAHLQHFSYLAGTEACQACHVVPTKFDDPSHIDDQPGAEVVFGPLAKYVTEGGARTPAATYNRNENSCSNVYCHGDWGLLKAQTQPNRDFIYAEDKMQGNTAVAQWTDPATGSCGTCHNVAPAGHNPYIINLCTGCHGSMIDENGIIIDNSKHVNGKVNVFYQEYPMF